MVVATGDLQRRATLRVLETFAAASADERTTE